MKRILSKSLLIASGVTLSLLTSCNPVSKDSDKNGSDESEDASVVAAVVAARLEAQKEAARLDSLRQDSIERNTLVDFGVKDFLKRKGNDVEVINWEASLKKIGFTKGNRKKVDEYEEYDEYVTLYKTVYTCESRAGNIVVEYSDTKFNLFTDFSWTIRFENPEQKEKFIQSLYDFGYKKATTMRDSEGKPCRYIAQIGNNRCPNIYWFIYDDYIVSGLSNC